MRWFLRTVLWWGSASALAAPAEKCVQIYYDDPADAQATSARIYAEQTSMALQNLLGHFPKWEKRKLPVSQYRAGDGERCRVNFYLGTYYDQVLPSAFLADYFQSRTTWVWLGYHLWQLDADALESRLGYRFDSLATLDWEHLDPKGRPGFFRIFEYQGETFEKYGEFLEGRADFAAAYEMTLLKPGAKPKADTVVLARHSGQPDRTAPYVVHAGQRWIVADIPFSYIHEADRYLIIADLLFDILEENPVHPGTRPALVRLEDVHALVPLWQLYGMASVFEKQKAPFVVSLIPAFRDPYGVLGKTPAVDLPAAPDLVEFLRYAEKRSGRIILHGFSHQYETERFPAGVSGDDYEFWDPVKGGPVAGDSPERVVGRVEKALSFLERVKLPVRGWVTPHYAASALDAVIFGQLFEWTIGRVWYTPSYRHQSRRLPRELTAERSGAKKNGDRLPYFLDLAVDTVPGVPMQGQFFPYEIYEDTYGSQVLPENLGYIQPPQAQRGLRGKIPITVDDLLARAKRVARLRDQWASFFIHPHLLGTVEEGGIAAATGDTREIERLISGVQALGFQFWDLKKRLR